MQLKKKLMTLACLAALAASGQAVAARRQHSDGRLGHFRRVVVGEGVYEKGHFSPLTVGFGVFGENGLADDLGNRPLGRNPQLALG